MQKTSLTICYVILLCWVLSNQFNQNPINIMDRDKHGTQNQTNQVRKPDKNNVLPLISKFLKAGKEEQIETAIQLFDLQNSYEDTRRQISVIFQNRKIFDEVKRVDLDEKVTEQWSKSKQEYNLTGKVVYFRPPAANFNLTLNYNQTKSSWEISSINIQR